MTDSASKTRIVVMHLIATNFFGGPEKQIVEHLTRLDPGRFRGIVGTFLEGSRPNDLLERVRVHGLDCVAVPMAGPLDARAAVRVMRAVRQRRVNLLCCHGYKAAVVGWWTGRLLGLPVIVFSRGYTAENRKIAFYQRLERGVLGRVSGVICVAEGQRSRLRELGVRPRRSWVVHNAVATSGLGEDRTGEREAVRAALGVPNGATMVVTAGRFSPEKGQRHLVEAVALLGEKARGAVFVLCGEGQCEAELRRKAADVGVAERFHFAGFRRDMMRVFRAMEFLVLPSLTEGLPNVVLEAFACGKAVVASAVGGVPELVRDRENGRLVPAGRADVLAEAIADCLSDPAATAAMGREGYRAVEADFGFDAQNVKLQEIYLETLREAVE